MPARECNSCFKMCSSPKQCSACKKAWYCSRECQLFDWVSHIFDCNPPRPVNTADHLALAVRKDLIPDHVQTRQDYGFSRTRQLHMLFGLYVGLFRYLEVKPCTVHKWRLNGTLVENIKKEFGRLPERSRGGYYAWFLENERVVSGAQAKDEEREVRSQVDDMLCDAWRFIGRSPVASAEDIRRYQESVAKENRDCFVLYAMLLARTHPGPNDDLWITFGFCACESYEAEMELARSYIKLIHRCTFGEFCTAYTSSALVSLLSAKGIDITTPLNVDSGVLITDVLSGTPRGNKSVWKLKQYIEVKTIYGYEDSAYRPIPSISVDYGFINCKTTGEHKMLIDIYKRFFALGWRAKPLELHQTCIQGRLFTYFMEDLGLKVEGKETYKRLLKNIYPLPEI